MTDKEFKNYFYQHMPACCDVGPPEEFGFDSEEQLLEKEVISRWSNRTDFGGFYMSENRLMWVSKDKTQWWVLGFVSKPLSFPVWNYHDMKDE